MSQIAANGIQLEYDEHGKAEDPPILLIMGLSAQMTAWDDEFVTDLAGRGFRVIRFDNRDIGLSTWFDDAGTPDLGAAMLSGKMPDPVYNMADMAADAAGLLDSLGIDRAHIVGASMGGMIAQTFAIAYPARTWSLTSIFSTTGNSEVGQPRGEVVSALFLAPRPESRDAVIEAGVLGSRLLGSPGFPVEEARIRERTAAAYDRAWHPDGVLRQTLAVIGQPDRTDDLKRLDVPTLVVHGDADPLVDPSGGRATAEAVPGAELWVVPGMGHDIPPSLFGELADRIAANCRKAM
jgi:pimeloyl-ACP methyl ester carboxylesterase